MQQQARGSGSDAALALAWEMQQSCLGVRVGRLHRLVVRRFEQALRPVGLSISQLEILSVLLLRDEPVTPTDLAGWLAVERSTMSRNLALMENHGHITATDTSPAGRFRKVAISQEGIHALAAADQAWHDAQNAVQGLLGDQAAPTLDTWLGALGAAGPH